MGITMSRERVWITTPYLAPGPDVLTALRTAAYRGVDVRLLVPRRSDNRLVQLAGRSFYPALLRAGVRVYEYLPAVLHGKTWVFDSEHLAIGSANLDNRSFKLNFEITCFLAQPRGDGRDGGHLRAGPRAERGDHPRALRAAQHVDPAHGVGGQSC